ncbi:hypothetical protein [Methyloglobulus sp.]|uniref:hypothetical protein n=1 Tax=Methyloglobulus sp. TaxID=2518622 RepID=UPI0032B7CE07
MHELKLADNFLNQVRIPKPSGKQLIALTLSSESLGIVLHHSGSTSAMATI